MNKGPLLLLAAVAVGLGAGYLIGAGSVSSAGRVAPRRGRQATEGYERPGVRGESGGTELSEAIAKLPVPKFARGPGVVRGRVRTRQGKPLAGVLVRLRPRGERRNRERRGSGAPADKPVEEVVRDAVRRHHEEIGRRLDATTGQDGRYEIRGLVQGQRHHVRAYREGYEITRTPPVREASRIEAGATVDFTAARILEFGLEILLPNGTPPESARISMRRGYTSLQLPWRPNQPPVRCKAGEYTITASIPADDAYICDPVVVKLVEGEPGPTITLRMRSQPGIRGSVTGTEAPDLRLCALRYVPEDPEPVDRLVRDGKRARIADDSRYLFKPLTPGHYLVGVVLGRALLLETRTVEVTDRMVELDIEVGPLPMDRFVRVRVLGPDGKPLKEVSFSTAYRTSDSSSRGDGTAILQPDRSWLVAHYIPRAGRPGGTYSIRAQSSRYGDSGEIEYVPGKRREIEIRFSPPARLSVTVSGLAGSRADGKLKVTLRRKEGDRWHSARIGPKGRARFGPITPGDYFAGLEVSVTRHESIGTVAVPVSLRAGDNALTLPAPALYTLTVLVNGSSRRVAIEYAEEGAGGWLNYRVAPKEGRATFVNLPAGLYLVKQEGKRMPVDLRADTEIPFVAEIASALRVLTQGYGPLHDAGLRDGDLVVAIDGTEIKNSSHAYALLRVAREKDRTVFGLLRGTARLEVTLSLKGIDGELLWRMLRPSTR